MNDSIKTRSLAATLCFICAITALSSCSGDLLKAVESDVAAVERQKALDNEENVSAEKRRPLITGFTTTVTGSTNNPTIPINISAEPRAVSTGGPAAIDGYFLSETNTTPTSGWSASVPVNFELSHANGAHTLYLWVKDSFGNVSNAAQLPVTLQPLPITWPSVYADNVTVTGHEVFTLTAGVGDSLVNDFTVSGIGAGTATVSGTTVAVTPTSRWASGPGTITIAGHTTYGLTISKSVPVTVFNGACVSTSGNDSNPGTIREPFKSIAPAISKCASTYSGTTSLVKIAKGTYSVDGNGASKITVSEGISLQGEYDPGQNFQVFAPATPLTTVIADVSTVGGSLANPLACISFSSGVTNDTTMSNIRVVGGSANYSPGVYCKDASPSITSCQILAGGTGIQKDNRYAVKIVGASAPEIIGNLINCAEGNTSLGGASDIIEVYGFEIKDITTSGCLLVQNKISGGMSKDYSIGIWIDSSDSAGNLWLSKNKFFPSDSLNTRDIYYKGTIGTKISNNLFYIGLGSSPNASSKATALFVNGSTSMLKFYNNTLVFGKPYSAGTEYGLYLQSLSPGNNLEFCNNLFCFYSTSGSVFGVYQVPSTLPKYFYNNGYQDFGTGKPLWANTTTTYETIALLHNYLSSVGSNNVMGGFTLSHTQTEYGLSTTDQRGLNGLAQGWGFSDDILGTTRTIGWSIGYFEKN